MSNERAVVRIQPSQQFDEEEQGIIRKTVASKTSPEQFALFLQVCKYSGLNPFMRQIYAVVRGSDMTIQTGIDGYRVLAERSGKYAGQIGPQWCGKDAEWKDVWVGDEPPTCARVGVLRKGFEHPLWGVAKYKAFYVSSNPLWTKMPDHMLAIRAEALALRKAFPAEMSGIYTAEEMEQADEHTPTVVPHSTVVESEDRSTNVTVPTSKEIYALGKEKGLWSDPNAFYAFASAELGFAISADSRLSAEHRLHLSKAIDEEQNNKAS